MFEVVRLRCEYLVNPLGIDETAPRLSWNMKSDKCGARQSAWRVLAASSLAKLERGEGDLWDSGRIQSGQSIHIEYAGRPLRSREVCHWRVQVWDETGQSALGAPAMWSMGLLEPDDWTAQWIAADPEIVRRDPDAIEPALTEPGTPALFRRGFEIPGAVRRATLYASARGLIEMSLNGAPVSGDIFTPEWTDYTKRIHYRAWDVTALTAPGANALGAVLGDGWWSGYVGWQETRARYGSLENSLVAQLEIELESGETMTVASDATWRCETGPILASDFMMGETCDARRERPGWDRPRFNDATWLPARPAAPPAASLVAQHSEPVRVSERLEPVSVREVEPGVYLFDLGQNIAGWVQLKHSPAPAGTRITIRHGERLTPEGELYTENLRRARATDVFIANGGPIDWRPRFTFHGFQYVEVRGLPTPPTTKTVTGCAVRSATASAGRFECSHEGVNRLWLNGLWSHRDNFLSVPTDCPQRDERLGWTGDAQVFMRTATYNMEVAAFFSKWTDDIADAQTPEGVFPDTAPRLPEGENFAGLDGLGGAAGWADAGIIVPWTLWRVYGDRRAAERHWDSMRQWLDWIEEHNPDGIRRNELGNNYGDWLCIPADTSFRTHSPMKTLLATAYWAGGAAKMAEMARAFGRDDAAHFEAAFGRVRDAFQKEFYAGDGRLTVETQTSYLLALAMDLLPKADRPKAAKRLVERIAAEDYHLSTGFIGISHLNPQLTLNGYPDIAWRLLLNEDYPSWLYPVRHGATTIWERWDGWTHERGFFNPHMNSFNHYSLGSVGEWLFRHAAGIEIDPESPGFQHFVLSPFPTPRLDFVKASYFGPYGEIAIQWEWKPERIAEERILDFRFFIPANSSARVYIPSRPGTNVSSFAGPIESLRSVRVIGREGDRLVCEVQSGSYGFESVI